MPIEKGPARNGDLPVLLDGEEIRFSEPKTRREWDKMAVQQRGDGLARQCQDSFCAGSPALNEALHSGIFIAQVWG